MWHWTFRLEEETVLIGANTFESFRTKDMHFKSHMLNVGQLLRPFIVKNRFAFFLLYEIIIFFIKHDKGLLFVP